MHHNNTAAPPRRPRRTPQKSKTTSPSKVWRVRRQRMEDRAVERYKVANGIADKSGVTLTKLRKLGHSWQASYNPQTRLSESLDRFCDIVERVIGGPA